MVDQLKPSLRGLLRGIFAVVLAYLLVFQSLTGSLKATNAADLAQAGFGVICASSDSHPTPTDPANQNCPDMQCCVLGGRMQIDVAVQPSVNELVIPELRLAKDSTYSTEQYIFVLSDFQLTPLQPRAPPAHLI